MTASRSTTQRQIHATAVRIRAGELVDVHLRAVAKTLEALKEDWHRYDQPGLATMVFQIPIPSLTPDQFMAVRNQLAQLLCEIEAKQTSLEPNDRQLDAARKEMGVE